MQTEIASYDESKGTVEEYLDSFVGKVYELPKVIADVRDIESWKGKVSIGNRLLGASFDLEVGERRFLHYALSLINTTKQLEVNTEFVITVSDFSHILDVDYSTAHSALTRATQTIASRYIIIEGITAEDGKSELPWFKKIIRQEGVITVIWNDCLIPYISNLGKLQSFTRLVNRESLSLTSKYSARLYELLSMERWKGLSGSLSIDLEELYYRWQIPENMQKYPVFKQRALDFAIENLKSKDILDISIEVPKIRGKIGRKVVRITFNYSFRHSLTEYGLVNKGRFGKLSKN